MRDETLLRDYVRNRSEAAFTRLMERYLPMVYAVCLRETGNRTLAEDATQAVFLVLARKAKDLRSTRALPSWLYRTARLAAGKLRQRERGRNRRERENVPLEYPARSAPDSIHLMLDDAIDTLSARERDAVLLRYFTGLSVLETADSLGISEGAAQMRISRALEKLQRYLSRRNAAVTGVGLVTLIAAMADREASAAMLSHAQSIATSAQPGSLTIGISIHQLAQGVIRSMTIAKLKIAAACGIALILAGTGVSSIAQRMAPISKASTITLMPKSVTPAVEISKTVIVLDPGHGGGDSGSVGEDGTTEKSLNLAIAKLTMASLSQQGYPVRLTRVDDSAMSIEDRVKLSQEAHATIFVSIHCDSGKPTDNHTGATAYYCHENRSADRSLAQLLSKQIAMNTGKTSNGVKSDKVQRAYSTGFEFMQIVLNWRMQAIPCTLIQCGYMNSNGDLRFLESAAGQKKIADGIAAGIKSYLDKSSVTPVQAMQQAPRNSKQG